MAVREITGKDPDGTRVGQTTTDLLGFYGQTPVARFATSIQIPSSAAVVSISATQWGFASSAQAQGIVSAVAQLTTWLSTLGLTSST
jgi:hypothetical protein